MRETPTTDELTRMTRQEAAKIAAGEVSDAIRRLSMLLCAATAQRLEREPEKLLRPSEAAKILGVARQYFYDHEAELPFTCRLLTGQLRISRRKLSAWIRSATNRKAG